MKHIVVPALLAGLLFPTSVLGAQDRATPVQRGAAARIQPAPQQQQKSVEELTDLYEKKIAKDFVAKGGWILDWDEASRRAREEGKPIFA